jgi:hypothetical protein
MRISRAEFSKKKAHSEKSFSPEFSLEGPGSMDISTFDVLVSNHETPQ